MPERQTRQAPGKKTGIGCGGRWDEEEAEEEEEECQGGGGKQQGTSREVYIAIADTVGPLSAAKVLCRLLRLVRAAVT